ncbi:EAL domain-containing protein [Lysobacter enzymogenes]|uniref:EAL domain-containing protein n=1 Tax=Lysobacter enzymogenes TaxID=69 RepID=UPI001A973799|nr:EAL domain-containing protein [Lysobacter enzymogenes]QQP95697.1 EAL domain-containing protein [Lysobacter enzymogenes]
MSVRPFSPAALLSAALIALLCAAAWPQRVAAATRDFYFSRLGSELGLSQNSVTAFEQDAHGFVWVGTQGGLHRYDGQRYIAYRHDPRDPASLPDSYVTALALDGQRALWIGTHSEYLARLDLASGSIHRYGAPESQAGRQVAALLPWREQVLIGTLAGLEKLDPQTGTRELLLPLSGEGARAAPWQGLAQGRDGSAWFASAAGLHRIKPDGRVERIGAPIPLRSLAFDHRGVLWAGAGDGLYRLDGRTGVLVKIEDEALAGLRDARALVEAHDRRLWIAGFGSGLYRYDPETGHSQRIHAEPGVDASLPEDTVDTLMVDQGGLLWAGGLYRGVAVADPRGTRFSYVLDLEDSRPDRAAADASIRALAQDDSGAIWIGTDNAHLRRYDLSGDRFQDMTSLLPAASRQVNAISRQPDAQAPPPAADAHAPAPAPATDAHASTAAARRAPPPGRLWLATGGGLLRLDPGTGRIEPVDLRGYKDAALRALRFARDGSLWLGGEDVGALHYQPDSGVLVRYAYREGDPKGLSHPRVNAILEDRSGRIWFGTGGGLDLLDPKTGYLRHYRHVTDQADSLPGNTVRALHQSADGSIWVGTQAGLSRVVEFGDGRIRFEHPLAEVLGDHPVPVVFTLAERPDGRLWLGTDNGILRFDPGASLVRRYGLADGLQDLEFNAGAVAALADGRLAFGGVRGLNLFDPARIADSRYTPPVRLLGAWIGSDTSAGASALWQSSKLEIPDGAGILRLRIGALDFGPNSGIRYRYRMEGFDRDWIDNGPRQDITYTRLPPGRYLFRAQSTNRDGVWNTQELTIPVSVDPPLWRHPLAIAAAALAALGVLLSFGWRWHRTRQRERGYFTQIREREERLKLALWASGEQFWDYDLTRRELHRMRVDDHNAQSPEIGVQADIADDHEIHPDDLPRVAELLRKHLKGDAALFLSEHRMRTPKGEWGWVRARGRVVERDGEGHPVRVAGTGRDVTAVRSAERERRIASEVLRSMAEAVAVFDRDFVFVSINPAFSRMTGYPENEVIGQTTGLLDSRQHDPEFYSDMRDELQRSGRWSGEIWQQRKDGNEFLCWLQASIVLDSSGQRGHYVAVLTDITDQKRAEQELRYLANYDTLTSLPNRTLLSERLSRAIVRARRHGHRIALLFLDLDRFKDINDSLGHAAGDRILRAAAVRLQETVGAEHTVARLGGDEFTVVLENLDTPEQAEDVARRIIKAFEAPLDFDERHDVAISPSIGISVYPDHAQVPTDLLKHADTAMYQAKAAGRRTFMRYTEAMDIEIRQRATISAALRKVLDRNELRLVFQPRLSLPEARITGVEALLRWQSAEYGNIPPTQFIPLAEESGLILEIGEWAMREACNRLRQWRQHGLDQLSVSVNVSAIQLLRGDLPKMVARALSESGIPPWRLELELTESVVMSNAAHTSNTMQALRELGVALAVDDFGTGYSSLAYLKRLPINTLKIDKEFISDLTRDPDDEAITTTVITMAHSLGLNVVAEGVELEEQMEFLRAHGCDEIQGYWLAKPLEADACLAFIKQWQPPQSVRAAF